MAKYIALLRAVNVGGTGKLPMAELKAMCADAGFARVETYIASGNVVFESNGAPSRVKAELERRLLAHAGKPVAHRELLQAVWGPDYGDEPEYLRVFINQVRKKIDDMGKDRLIKTVPGRGYKIEY